jgi:hypothetical protein
MKKEAYSFPDVWAEVFLVDDEFQPRRRLR